MSQSEAFWSLAHGSVMLTLHSHLKSLIEKHLSAIVSAAPYCEGRRVSKQSYTNTSERFVSHGHVGSFTLVTPSGVHNEGTLEEEEKSGHKVAATLLSFTTPWHILLFPRTEPIVPAVPVQMDSGFCGRAEIFQSF